MKRSTRLGVLYFLARTTNISEEQRAFLAHLQGKADLQEINRAWQVYSRLNASKRVQARMGVQTHRFPALPLKAKHLKEERRIGVGYRDKGSLRSPTSSVTTGEVTVNGEHEDTLQQHFGWTPRSLEVGEVLTSEDYGLQFARSLTAERRAQLLRGQSYPEGGYPQPEGQQEPTRYWDVQTHRAEGKTQKEKEALLFSLLEREGISRASWELLKEIIPSAPEPTKAPEIIPLDPPTHREQSALPLLRERWRREGLPPPEADSQGWTRV